MRIPDWVKETLLTAGLALGLAEGGLRSSGRGSLADAAQQATQREPDTALVFVNDYQPGVAFRAVSRIQQPTVNQILGYVDPASPGDGDGAVVDPTDWTGYIVNYRGCGPGNYTLVFLREGALEVGQSYWFTTDAVFFSNRLQLVEPEVRTGTPGQQAATGDDAEGQAEGEGETTTEETTTEETTTEETTTTEATTTETETPATEETTTAEQTTTTETTAEGGTTTEATTETTTTPEDATTTTTAEGTTTTTTSEETTTQEVVVNATETTTESG